MVNIVRLWRLWLAIAAATLLPLFGGLLNHPELIKVDITASAAQWGFPRRQS
ncbi:hypothetical protein KCP76_03220 [Salmonella enterica subsp. enterica serovar Weltevreden]|nr:hypothetical protein KCP76_03220 [Salmonella enterica subsp. enterica serovar Weltevreden]